MRLMRSEEPNCDSAVHAFYRNQESFWHKSHFNDIFHAKDLSSGVARGFPCGLLSHPEDQNKEANESSLRKTERTYRKMGKDWGNVLILATPEWGTGYGPGYEKNYIDTLDFPEFRNPCFYAIKSFILWVSQWCNIRRVFFGIRSEVPVFKVHQWSTFLQVTLNCSK